MTRESRYGDEDDETTDANLKKCSSADGRRERSIIKPHLRSPVTANQGAFDSSSSSSSSSSIHSQFCLTPHCFAGAAEGSPLVPSMSRDS